MSVTVAAVLAHPTLRAARPVVRAGSRGLEARVRWVHSSEVLEIASLLRGGELLLTGGDMLSSAPESEQRRYVRELAARQVAGVAIETGPRMRALPAPMLAEADALGLPVVELRAVVPFVGVTEAVNAELVNDSVTRLRHSGELAHALSGVLSDGGGVQALLEVLVARTGASAAVFDTSGRLLGQVGESLDHVATTYRVMVRGVHAATLTCHPPPGTDLELLAGAGERACEAIGLALLKSRPPSPRDLAAAELARLATQPDHQGERLLRLAEVIGISASDPALGIAIHGPTSSSGLHGLDALLRRYGHPALALADSDARVVVSMEGRRQASRTRAELVEALGGWARERDDLVIGVGPVVPELAAVATSMSCALGSVDLRAAYGRSVVVDAAAVMGVDLLGAADLLPRAEQLVLGQLGMLLALGGTEREVLLETLETYFDTGCHKTRTAEALHVQRQSLYARLERAFTWVGGDPTGTPRALSLHLALKLRHRLRLAAGTGSR